MSLSAWLANAVSVHAWGHESTCLLMAGSTTTDNAPAARVARCSCERAVAAAGNSLAVCLTSASSDPV